MRRLLAATACRATTTALAIWLALSTAGCVVRYDFPPGWDGGASRDASTLPDGSADGGCATGTKPCGDACVSVDNPATGCGDASCDPCLFDHGAAICISGACALGDCENGWGNCDLDDSSGCETDLLTTQEHCGSCTRTCNLPGTDMICELGSCQFIACHENWTDCDDDIDTNGCEADLLSDDDNCQFCGLRCPAGFTCNNGYCRCHFDEDCNTGGGGTCDPGMLLCACPTELCDTPCQPDGTGCL